MWSANLKGKMAESKWCDLLVGVDSCISVHPSLQLRSTLHIKVRGGAVTFDIRLSLFV